MRFQKQRYILFEYITLKRNVRLIDKEIIRSIWESMIKLFGEYNSYFSGLWMIKFNPKECWGIIRCTNKTKEKVITALAFITEIKKVPIIFHTIKTSGTIKKVLKIQKYFYKKNRQ
ncbi:MAG: Rpp14/Pop5 family protein [Promethearchaeota archaeon]